YQRFDCINVGNSSLIAASILQRRAEGTHKEGCIMNKIRVLVVDDSALARKILSDQLNQYPEIEVVGTAQDGTFVISKIRQYQPDVITLDVEMRQKGGLEVLPELMGSYNIPVIMV